MLIARLLNGRRCIVDAYKVYTSFTHMSFTQDVRISFTNFTRCNEFDEHCSSGSALFVHSNGKSLGGAKFSVRLFQ